MFCLLCVYPRQNISCGPFLILFKCFIILLIYCKDITLRLNSIQLFTCFFVLFFIYSLGSGQAISRLLDINSMVVQALIQSCAPVY